MGEGELREFTVFAGCTIGTAPALLWARRESLALHAARSTQQEASRIANVTTRMTYCGVMYSFCEAVENAMPLHFCDPASATPCPPRVVTSVVF
jgi:hypothetical protein